MTAVQLTLDLDLWPDAAEAKAEAELWRHEPHDLADHQRGLCRVPWDTGGAWRQGDRIPAWVCCKCGRAEPTAFTLQINHGCGSPYSCCPSGADHWPLVDG